MLSEDFLKPMGLTQRQIADSIHVPYQRINEIINGRRGVTPRYSIKVVQVLWCLPRFLAKPSTQVGFVF